jgi:hypothetical protein
MAQSKVIFQQENVNPRTTIAKAHRLMIEVIEVRGVKSHNVFLMEKEEKDWLRNLIMGEYTQPRNILSQPKQGVDSQI